MGIWIGAISALVGISCAVAGWVAMRREATRLGDTEPMTAVLAPGRDTVEREIYRRAACLAFPCYVVASAVISGAAEGGAGAGVALGLAGLLFGAAAGISGARLSR